MIRHRATQAGDIPVFGCRVASIIVIMRKPLTDEQKAAKRERARANYDPVKERLKNEKFRASSTDYFKDYYAANRERRLADSIAWAKANPDAAKKKARDAYVRRAALGKKVRSDDKDAARVRTMNRRAIEKSGEPITKSFLAALFAAQKGRCAGCGKSIKARYHADHITPLSRGGEHTRNNMQLLCPPCNLGKHAKDPIDWRQTMGQML